ncbi:MAG TPA: DUF1579 family protein [Blastocatellia bacterium]|nr:DUF1579 family protein [Blastocatellia bacterium]
MTMLLMIFLTLMLSFPAGQQNRNPNTERGDEASKKVDAKPNQPGERHRQLDYFVGSWDVQIKFKIGGQEREGRALLESRWVLNGRFLKQEYKTMTGGVPFTVVQYVGFDNNRKKTVEVKFDSNDTGVQVTEGTLFEDGKIISNSGERVDPTTGRRRGLRTVTIIFDKDHYTVEWYQVGDDGKEDKVVTLSHTRNET